MPRKANTHDSALTPYEQRQVDKIAAWKASHPGPLGELFKMVTRPAAKLVERAIPDALALGVVNAAYKAAQLSATRADIEAQAGVQDIGELRGRPMELCDDLSRRVGTMAQGVAVLEGALTGAGGVWTTLLDVPLLFGVCLRTIVKNGHCYGYTLDRPTDKAWVLAALAVALSSSKERRTTLLARLREIEDLLLEEIQEDIIIEETVSLLTQIEVFEDIPLFGAATGALLNLSTAHRADVTARHLFQERWLRDNGKVQDIPAAEGVDKMPDLVGWSGALARVGYRGVYGLGFAAGLPVALVGRLLSPNGRPREEEALAAA